MVIASQWLLFGEICPLVFDGLFRWILSSKEWISVLGLGLVVEWVDVLSKLSTSNFLLEFLVLSPVQYINDESEQKNENDGQNNKSYKYGYGNGPYWNLETILQCAHNIDVSCGTSDSEVVVHPAPIPTEWTVTLKNSALCAGYLPHIVHLNNVVNSLTLHGAVVSRASQGVFTNFKHTGHTRGEVIASVYRSTGFNSCT